jgi:hypothetical protein
MSQLNTDIDKKSSSSPKRPTGSGAYPASYSVLTKGPFSGVGGLGVKPTLPASGSGVKNEWVYTSLPLMHSWRAKLLYLFVSTRKGASGEIRRQFMSKEIVEI